MAFQKQGQPVISIDTKKKELVGPFNGGREYRPTGQPQSVQVHDFPDRKLGKAITYGVYDVSANQGWGSVGVDHDTAEFATESVKRWWRSMGQPLYPQATELLITADGGGSNSSRSRLWKVSLQKLADELGLKLSVCHSPPATSKYRPHHYPLKKKVSAQQLAQVQISRNDFHGEWSYSFLPRLLPS